MSTDRAARSSANTHDGASHHGRLGRPVASQDQCRLAEAVGWVRSSILVAFAALNRQECMAKNAWPAVMDRDSTNRTNTTAR